MSAERTEIVNSQEYEPGMVGYGPSPNMLALVAMREAEIPRRQVSPRNWTEDFCLENGCYSNQCVRCNGSFLGHKRRILCRVCLDGDALDSFLNRVRLFFERARPWWVWP